MIIEKIYVDGFKNIHELDFNLGKTNILLSTNNYGKSNVLDAIRFGFEFIKNTASIKSRQMSFRSATPIGISDLAKNFVFDIVFKTENGQMIKYGFSFCWTRTANDRGRIVEEHLKIKESESTPKYISYIERKDNKAFYKTSKTGRCDKEINIDSNDLVVNKIKAYDDLFYIDIINSLNNDIDLYVDRHFDSTQLFDVIPFIEKNIDLSSPSSDSSIARLLHNLKKTNKNRYELIINTFKDFFPYVEDIKIKEISVAEKTANVKIDDDAPFELAEYVYMLVVTNKHLSKTSNFSSMSDGAKRILSLLTYMTLADINKIPLVGIEEPENSIHPGLLKKYMSVIDGFMSNSKIIITSHSPYLINYVDLTNLFIGLPNESGRASFNRVSNFGANRLNIYANDAGEQTGDFIFSILNGVDEFDLELLKRCLENA